MENFILKGIGFLLAIGTLFFAIYLSGRTKPLFPKYCQECKKTNRNWKVVHIGHDDFAWRHECTNKSN